MLPIASDHTTRLDLRVNPQDPSTWLAPGDRLIDADGRDWAWCYVLYREIEGFPAYCVGTNGSVWSRCRRGGKPSSPDRFAVGYPWRRLVPARSCYGYLTYMVARKGERRVQRRLHRDVLEAFVGPCHPGMEGRHLNGVKEDNRLRNLAWGTPAENQADRVRHGTDGRGARGSGAVLTESQVREIRRKYAGGIRKTRLAEEYGVTRTNIYCIVTRKTWTEIPDGQAEETTEGRPSASGSAAG